MIPNPEYKVRVRREGRGRREGRDKQGGIRFKSMHARTRTPRTRTRTHAHTHTHTQGEWKPRQIDNPNYQGEWEHPKIPNPEYEDDTKLYLYEDFGHIGFDLWQVRPLEKVHH